jgi:hypothetical protein
MHRDKTIYAKTTKSGENIYYTNTKIYTFLADDIHLIKKSFNLEMCIISFIVVSLLLRCTNPFSRVESVIRTVKRILISSYLRKKELNEIREHECELPDCITSFNCSRAQPLSLKLYVRP